MVEKMILDDTVIQLEEYKEEKEDGLHKLTVRFFVTNENYHEITTLLYKGRFQIKVPERELNFFGNIQQYYTSITNLYVKGQVGEFTVSFSEVQT
ncbi:DUF3219 family protein [Anaerobacillus alkaliphilus]|uniref:DUF3219 family protein n=1 Tax=Anaerobacillus alkaliphilus TaxID=1548597 RepID=A0A4Q0VXZ9_9BACI|nr:DUF3219 family protein [Anaerobacillus alkaliphilus]RXJ04584.1 DUF3219 family protein [Anaerobacillus alkaliphilus]